MLKKEGRELLTEFSICCKKTFSARLFCAGDCWLLSGIALLADRKELLERVFVHEAFCSRGFYQLRLCKEGRWRIVYSLLLSHFHSSLSLSLKGLSDLIHLSAVLESTNNSQMQVTVDSLLPWWNKPDGELIFARTARKSIWVCFFWRFLWIPNCQILLLTIHSREEF